MMPARTSKKTFRHQETKVMLGFPAIGRTHWAASVVALVALGVSHELRAQTDAPEGTQVPSEPTTEPTAASPEELLERIEAQDKALADQQRQLAAMEQRLELTQQALADAATPTDETQEATLRTYGFLDFGLRRTWLVRQNSQFYGLNPEASTFLFGNLNYYFDAKPIEDFRALTELRFTPFPHGATSASTYRTLDSEVYDNSSATGSNFVQVGGVIIERAQIDWTRYDPLNVSVGYFLTPYGIWNVDHGSPTLIPNAMPFFFAREFFPTRLLGVQLLGSFPVDNWEFGYRAYVSNGRYGTRLDDHDDKLVGGRVYSTHYGTSTVTAGVSGFYGGYRERDVSLAQVEPLRFSVADTVVYEEAGFAGDVSVDWNALRFRAEYVGNTRWYEAGKRPEAAPGTYAPDAQSWSAYGLLAYRLPVFGLEPYAFYERGAAPRAFGICSLGLNIHFNEAIKLKTQYFYVRFPGQDTSLGNDNFHDIDVRYVMAF